MPLGSREASRVFTSTVICTAARPNTAGQRRRAMRATAGCRHSAEGAHGTPSRRSSGAGRGAGRARRPARRRRGRGSGLEAADESQHREDHREVEHGGPDRRGEEPVVGVERAHRERGQTHEEQVREHERGSGAPRGPPAAGSAAQPGAMTVTIHGATSGAEARTTQSTTWPHRTRRARGARTPRGPRGCSVSVKTGMTAVDSAPSARSRRRRFGIRKATKNASVTGPAPKARATTMSRT